MTDRATLTQCVLTLITAAFLAFIGYDTDSATNRRIAISFAVIFAIVAVWKGWRLRQVLKTRAVR